MKKLLAIALLGMVSWSLAVVPAQASEVSKPGTLFAKNHRKHHKHQKRSRKHKRS